MIFNFNAAFVDVSPEETFQNTAFENYNDSSSPTPSEITKFAEVICSSIILLWLSKHEYVKSQVHFI